MTHSLSQKIFETLVRDPKRIVLIDHCPQRRAISAGLLLALGYLFAKHLKKQAHGRRIGIVLPPGLACFVAHLGAFFAGKTPVNLNFTAPAYVVNQSIEKAQIKTLISAKMMQDKLADFPWLSDTIDIASWLKQLSHFKIGSYIAMIRLLPFRLLRKCLDIPQIKPNQEATVLFTSGSESDIKGVVLSHENLVSQVQQIAACGILPKNEKLLASLPIFHSFGFTATLIYPLLAELTVVTTPSPLDIKKIAQLIRQEQVTVHLGTPSFFYPYLKWANPDDLKSLKYVIAGAQKTPAGMAKAWQDRFGSIYLEGYGLAETSPVVSVNLPGSGYRLGSVGRLLKHMQVRTICPSTQVVLPAGQPGIIELKGPNVFSGYLDNPVQTQNCFQAGWFRTGDLGYIDSDGFLYIEGRLARFSKIGGEMVSHGAIEEALRTACSWEEPVLPWVVTAIEDAQKGEALVLLTIQDITLEDVHQQLGRQQFPNLWLPKYIVKIDTIPLLASGKLDMKACQAIAFDYVKAHDNRTMDNQVV